MSDFNKIAYFKCLRGIDFGRNTGAVQVLTALYTYSDADGGNARPGVERLGDDCCMDPSTVRRHLKLLTKRGLIRQESRGGRSKDGRSWASSYRLCVPSSTAQPPAVDEEGSPAQPTAVETPSTAQPPAVDEGFQPLTSALSTAHLELSTAQPRTPTKSLTPSHLHQVSNGYVSNAREVPAVPDTALAKPSKRATRLTEDWQPSSDTIGHLKAKYPSLDHRAEFEKFQNWHIGKGTKWVSWDRALQNWFSRAGEDQTPARNGRINVHSPPSTVGKPTQKALGHRAAGAELLAEMENQ